MKKISLIAGLCFIVGLSVFNFSIKDQKTTNALSLIQLAYACEKVGESGSTTYWCNCSSSQICCTDWPSGITHLGVFECH